MQLRLKSRALGLSLPLLLRISGAVAAEPQGINAESAPSAGPSGTHQDATEQPPDDQEVQANTAQDASEAPNELCKLDPAACPTQDVKKSGPEILLTGPIVCAEAASSAPNLGAKNSKQIVLPTGQMEVGGEMVFITSDAGLDAQGQPLPQLRLTDLSLFRLRLRRSFSDWLELYATNSLLAKQPVDFDQALWQGTRGGARLAFADHFAAQLSAAGGPLFREHGYWWQATPGIQAKANISYLLRFDLGMGSTTTVVQSKLDQHALWLEELDSHAEIQFGDNQGAFWVRLDYAVPLASGPSMGAPDPKSGRFINPQVRLAVEAGGVLTVGRSGWDAYFAYSFIDRGELDRPETMLPILNQGFDQSQILLGVQHRFDTDLCEHRSCGKCYD